MAKHSTDFLDYLDQGKTASEIPVGGGEDYANRYLTAKYDPENAVETRMQGKELGKGQFSAVQGLSEKKRLEGAVQLPVAAGTRVQFASNTGAVLTYSDPPNPNDFGTVVAVKSASHGNITSHAGKVFVEWSDGECRAIFAEHLRYAQGTQRRALQLPNKFRVASLGDLAGFFGGSLASADKSGELVHKATKDLWSFRQEGGEYIIERLFDDTGAPLKE
jgi:hypothetical protein